MSIFMKNAGLFGLLFVIGCSSVSHEKVARPNPAPQRSAPVNNSKPLTQGTIFLEDKVELSDAELTKIFSANTGIRTDSKVAIYYHNSPTWSQYRFNSLEKYNQKLTRDSIVAATKNSKINTVMILPGLILPKVRNISTLRLAAARCQADLLFIYQTETRKSEKSAIIGASDYRVEVTVESALVDVRSGLIVFASSATGRNTVEEEKSDFNEFETQSRASQKAMAAALKLIEKDVAGFLKTQA